MILKTKFNTDAEWRENRDGYIGGSDAGAVLGLNPYKSPFTLWAEKTGNIENRFTGSIATEVGNELEDYVSRKFCGETGKRVRKLNYTLVNTDYPWACANVDRVLIGEKAILECKTTSSLPIMRRTRNGEFPETWYCQVMHYMAVLGPEYKRAYLAVLVSNREFHWYTIERDEAEISALMAAEREFWELVKTNTPPPVDGMASTADTIKAIWGDDDGTDAGELSRDVLQALESLKAAKDAKKAAEELITQAENIIKSELQEHSYGRAGNWRVTYKAQKRDSLDKKALAADHPEIDLEHYTKTSTYRVLRYKED